MPSAALAGSASSKTMTGALPPNSRCTRFRVGAAAAATSMPARTEPVTETMAGVSCTTRARPVSRSPQATLQTPGGGVRAPPPPPPPPPAPGAQEGGEGGGGGGVRAHERGHEERRDRGGVRRFED